MACLGDHEMRVRIGVHRLRDRTVVIPVGEIDLATSGVQRQCLAGCSGHVVVDLAGVTFLDSSGIGVLSAHRKRLLDDGGSVELRAPRPEVRVAIEAVGLGDWFELT
jgi:anti-anti-sigma factor